MTSKTCKFTGTKDPAFMNMAALGDIHTAHKDTPTSLILENLEKAFPRNTVTAALDVIVITGDWFDGLINLPMGVATQADNHNTSIVGAIEIYVIGFLRMCAEYDICVWIVEGTPSHDRRQSFLFEHLNKLYEIGATIYYATKLEVVHFERFNADVLFVPDEWRVDPNDTYIEARCAISDAGLETVHYAVMHGAFEHQLPSFLSSKCHDAKLYLDLVSEYIFIGHVHFHSIFERIIAAGSFDRLAFGEESPKGHVRVKVRGGITKDTIEFIENTTAKIYKSFDVSGLSPDDIIDLVRAANLPDGSAVRLLCHPSDAAIYALRQIRNTLLDYTFATKTISVAVKTEITELLTKPTKVAAVDLKPDNILRMLEDKLRQRSDLSDAEVEHLVEVAYDVMVGRQFAPSRN